MDIAFGKTLTFPLLDAAPQNSRRFCPMDEPRLNIEDKVCDAPITKQGEKLIEIGEYGHSIRLAASTPPLGEQDPSNGTRDG
jgi:hypothetical protein